MVHRKTHGDFVDELAAINHNIEVLGEYVRALTKVKVRCKLDNYEWLATPNGLLTGHGCPKCGGSMRKTHRDFVSELYDINKNVLVLNEYKNAHTKVTCECALCQHVWFVTPNGLLKGYGCPKCNDTRKTKQELVEELITVNPNIEVLGEYQNTRTKIKVRCIDDGYEWEAKPSNLLSGVGCPKCNGGIKKTPEQFVEELKALNPNIEVLGEYVAALTKIKVRCKIDKHEWSVIPSNLLRGGGCPKCANYGYDQSKQGHLYLYTFQKYLGFGITNVPETRYKQHIVTFNKLNIEAQLLQQIEGDGLYIQQLEAHLKKTLPIVDSGVKGFRTEAILYRDYELLFKAVEEFKARQPT